MWYKSKMKSNECQFQCKELYDWDSYKNNYIWSRSTYDSACNKVCKIDEYLDIIKLLTWKTSNLELKCEDEMLKTTGTLLNDKKVTGGKSNCHIQAIILVMKCFLLLVVLCVSCYFYYGKYRPK